jgi:hypothetical protein
MKEINEITIEERIIQLDDQIQDMYKMLTRHDGTVIDGYVVSALYVTALTLRRIHEELEAFKPKPQVTNVSMFPWPTQENFVATAIVPNIPVRSLAVRQFLSLMNIPLHKPVTLQFVDEVRPD